MKIRYMKLGEETLIFQYFEDHNLVREISLEAGFKYLTDTFFKKDFPTEIETEYAINYIEDELMKYKELANNDENLVFTHEKFLSILGKNGYEKNIYSHNNIESIFSKYASIVMGEPLSRLNIELNNEDYAIVLLLREIMYHLKFEEVTIVNS